jgi:tRNA pseudouridine55 synthase
LQSGKRLKQLEPRTPGVAPRAKRDVHGWLVLDKPVGITSAKRAGHAGTLDPLASGVLPIALGEATKTVPFVMEGRKIYNFTVRWGEERDTDDAEGQVTATSGLRPSAEEVRAILPRFTGVISQVPPRFSAIKVAGERAYDLARDGEMVKLDARPIEIHHLEWLSSDNLDHAVLAAECGKGAYIRALARDMGRALGCLGHVVALRRTAVGPFMEKVAARLEQLQTGDEPEFFLLPVETGLVALPTLRVSSADAGRLARGQSVLLRGRDAPVLEGLVSVLAQGGLIALAEAAKGELRPRRIFNLPRT